MEQQYLISPTMCSPTRNLHSLSFGVQSLLEFHCLSMTGYIMDHMTELNLQPSLLPEGWAGSASQPSYQWLTFLVASVHPEAR